MGLRWENPREHHGNTANCPSLMGTWLLMELPWGPWPHLGSPWHFQGVIVPLWKSHGTSMGVPWCFQMGSSPTGLPWDFRGTAMAGPTGYILDFVTHGTSRGTPVGLPLGLHGSGSIGIRTGLPTQRHILIVTMDSLGQYTTRGEPHWPGWRFAEQGVL